MVFFLLPRGLVISVSFFWTFSIFTDVSIQGSLIGGKRRKALQHAYPSWGNRFGGYGLLVTPG